MEYYGPYTARAAWTLYRAIDWTHMHHEQTYDIMADKGIPWSKKKEWTDRAVWYYLTKNSVARRFSSSRCHDASGGRNDEALLRLFPEQLS